MFDVKTLATLQFWQGNSELAVMGSGDCLPGKPISTDELLKHVDKAFGLDIARRGQIYAQKLNINERYLCRDLADRFESPRKGNRNPELAAKAVQNALDEAGLKPNDLGYLIGHTATPASPVPSNIAFVADELSYYGPHMELRQACTGFANALVIAEGLLAHPNAKPVAIVGSETGSVFFDPVRLQEDSGQLVNLVQMGDGAAAVILAPRASNFGDTSNRRGTLSKVFYGQIGQGRAPGFCLPSGGSDEPVAPNDIPEFSHAFEDVRSNGPELFLAGLSAAQQCNLSPDTVDFILPHQANGLMDILMEKHLGVPGNKVVVQADKVGNTGSAAIWLAFVHMRKQMQKDQRLLVLGAEATKYMFGGFLYQQN